MNNISIPNLLPEDITAAIDTATQTLRETDTVCTSVNKNEISQHQTKIEGAQHGLESLFNFLGRQRDQIKTEMEAVEAMQNDLVRHNRRCVRAYKNLKEPKDSSSSSNS